MSPSKKFIQRTARDAAQMPIGEACEHLRGLLELAGGNKEVDDLRRAYVLLDETRRMLETLSENANPSDR